jgi:hypothetical protein
MTTRIEDPKIRGIRANQDGTVTLCDDEECCPVVSKLQNGDLRVTGDDGQYVDLSPARARLLGLLAENE